MGKVTEDTVRRLRQGDQAALEEIYRATSVYLCTVSMYYVHDRHIASSIVNDVFVSFWDKRAAITYPPLPYLRRSVINASISFLRSSLFRQGALSVGDEKTWDFIENKLLSGEDPLRMLESSDLYEQVKNSIDRLSPKCKTVFEACLYEGKTYQEIAEEHGISVSTVRVHVKNALDFLRSDLSMALWVLVAFLLER